MTPYLPTGKLHDVLTGIANLLVVGQVAAPRSMSLK